MRRRRSLAAHEWLEGRAAFHVEEPGEWSQKERSMSLPAEVV